jgi:hypothetical protein
LVIAIPVQDRGVSGTVISQAIHAGQGLVSVPGKVWFRPRPDQPTAADDAAPAASVSSRRRRNRIWFRTVVSHLPATVQTAPCHNDFSGGYRVEALALTSRFSETSATCR